MNKTIIDNIRGHLVTQTEDIPKISSGNQRPTYTTLRAFQDELNDNDLAIPSHQSTKLKRREENEWKVVGKQYKTKTSNKYCTIYNNNSRMMLNNLTKLTPNNKLKQADNSTPIVADTGTTDFLKQFHE